MNTRRKSNGCSKANKKPKSSTNVSLDSLLRSINRTNDTMYERSGEIADLVERQRAARLRLRRCIQQVHLLENDLRAENREFSAATEELNHLVTDVKTPQLYQFDNDSQTVFNVHVNLAEQDVSSAYRQIKDVERELDVESPIVKRKGTGDASAIEQSLRCYDEVRIPSNDCPGIIGNDTNDRKCVICLDNQIDCVLHDCGHICICSDCAYKLSQYGRIPSCPICRSRVKNVIRIRKL